MLRKVPTLHREDVGQGGVEGGHRLVVVVAAAAGAAAAVVVVVVVLGASRSFSLIRMPVGVAALLRVALHPLHPLHAVAPIRRLSNEAKAVHELIASATPHHPSSTTPDTCNPYARARGHALVGNTVGGRALRGVVVEGAPGILQHRSDVVHVGVQRHGQRSSRVRVEASRMHRKLLPTSSSQRPSCSCSSLHRA